MVVSGWVGSDNLGDELVHAGLAVSLRRLGIAPVAVSQRPSPTVAAHGHDAVRPSPVAVVSAARRAAGPALGGGGLIQDETSAFNLPYHLARPLLARAVGRPFAAVALGAGPLHGRGGRALVRAVLGGAVATSVRDAASADLLAGLGLPRPVVAPDAALALPPPEVEVEDRVVVSLRPWSGRRGRLPVRVRRRIARAGAAPATPEWFLAGAAAAVDEVASTTGLAVRFVAFEGAGDHAVHEAVARRLASSVPVSFAVPSGPGAVAKALEEVARARVMIAQRYHARIAAVLGARPAVLVGYSPKVDALAAELGPAGIGVPWSPPGLAAVPSSVASVLCHGDAMAETRARLREREHGNAEVLQQLLAASGATV